MRNWIESIIQGCARSVATWASYIWQLFSFRKSMMDWFDNLQIRNDLKAQEIGGAILDKLKEGAREGEKYIPDTQVTRDVKERLGLIAEGETMAKKKSKTWTFFKVIMFIGVLMAVAIFILDRILPKPYEDDDLDDAWAGDDFDTDDDFSEAERPPTADVAYDVNDEDDEDEDDKSEEK